MPNDAASWIVIVGNTSTATLLLAGTLGLVRYRTLAPGLRYLVGLVWFGVAMEATSALLHHLKISNLLLMPLDASVEIWMLSLVFAWALQAPGFARLRPWLAGGFVAYAAISSGLAPEFNRFKPGVLVLECLLVLTMVAMYFRKLLNELRVQRLTQDPMFWVSTGLLVYFLGKLQIALFSNYMLTHYSRPLNLWLWTGIGCLSVVLYLCYARALWMRPQR